MGVQKLQPDVKREWTKFGHSLQRGMVQTLAANGIGNMGARFGSIKKPMNASVINAARPMKLAPAMVLNASAPTIASRHSEEQVALIMKSAAAPTVAFPSLLADTLKPAVAPVRVLSISAGMAPQPVFNLTVADAHEYFANGVLVHNCDALRYLCAYLDMNAGGLAETDIADLLQDFRGI